ncbi:MAG TPA: hypothetical protein PKW56_06360, partial [Clostridiales bacterium]|nr:hypothetical protein [Clostridiales bacterium]
MKKVHQVLLLGNVIPDRISILVLLQFNIKISMIRERGVINSNPSLKFEIMSFNGNEYQIQKDIFISRKHKL